MQTYVVVIVAVFVALMLLCAAFVYLIAPATARRRETLRFANVRYAHRGLHGDGVAENSLSAMKRAVEHGYGIELDVRLSSDGVPVVFHDEALGRACGVSGAVSDFTAEQLSSLSLFGTGEGVPTFSDVLSVVGGRVPLLVEIKGESADTRVCAAAMEALRDYGGDYIVESFNPLYIKWFRENEPQIIRGILSSAFLRKKKTRTLRHFFLQSMMLNFLCRPDFVAYNHKHSRAASLYLCRAFGAPTFAWTVRSEDEEKVARERGFDGVIFEGYIPNDGEKTDENEA